MKTCPTCGNKFEERFKFCPECGAASETSAVDVSMGEMRTVVGGEAQRIGDRGSASLAAGRSDGDADVSVGDARTMAPQKAESTASKRGGDAGESVEKRYEILEEIGRGGFARVWKARDLKLGRIVALKRLTPEALSGPEGARTLERFRREAQAIASLNHRNVVGVYDRGEDAQGPYIVMEYVDGGSLRDLLKEKGRLEPAEAVRIAVAVAKGLDHAHRKNLVHRDIKPANILLHREGAELVPKIADFGLARAGTDTGVSMSGYGMGTPAYMPPEQRRDAKNVNHTADLYALGKTLYEMMTGLPPDDVDADKLPPSLAGIVKRCVKPSPEERYFSAADLLADLERATISKDTAETAHAPAEDAGAGNVCPACGKDNAKGVRFCAGCGGGLVRVCPECGGDVSVREDLCGACGTDVKGFERFRDGIAQMDKYVKEKQWDRVLKEHGLLPSSARMPGAKARELMARARILKTSATRTLEEIDKHRRAAEAAEAGGRWAEARDAAKACLALDPHAAGGAERLQELEARAEDGVWLGALSNARNCEANGRFDEAVGFVRSYLSERPEGRHAQDAREEQARLERLETLDPERVRLLAADDFAGAEARLAEMARAGLSERGASGLKASHQRARDARSRRQGLRRKRIATGIAAVAALVAVAVMVGVWRDRQAVRMLSEAEAAKARNDWPTAVDCVRHALSVRPNDPRARAVYGEACAALAPKEGREWVSPATGMTFVWVPVIKGWVGKYEVTNGEYRKMKRWHRSGDVKGVRLDTDRQPVVQVCFDDARAFAEWLSAADRDRLCGCAYRLPSESEWQTFATCGGILAYPWGIAMPPQSGNYADASAMRVLGFAGLPSYDDKSPATCPVELSGMSGCGLFGVGGNVWECCAADAHGASFGAWRGASWANFGADELRCAHRCATDGATRNATFGFRLVLAR